jgi:signal transduction histidine kinase
LLDISRITRGTLELRRKRTHLSNVVEAALETARPAIDAKRHSLEVHLPQVPVTFDVDPLRVSQVLSNLLTNAAKYTDPEGLIQLAAELVGGDVLIRVVDNGIPRRWPNCSPCSRRCARCRTARTAASASGSRCRAA